MWSLTVAWIVHVFFNTLSHDRDTIHAEKRCAEMHDFHMAILMFLTGHGIKARTHAHAEIAHVPTRCIIRTWKALGLWLHAHQAPMMHLNGKFAISAWAWVLDIYNVFQSWYTRQWWPIMAMATVTMTTMTPFPREDLSARGKAKPRQTTENKPIFAHITCFMWHWYWKPNMQIQALI